MSKKVKRSLLEALDMAFGEGRKWVLEGNEAPSTEEELNFVLDTLFERQEGYWSSLIDAAGTDAVDGAFYVGTSSGARDRQ